MVIPFHDPDLTGCIFDELRDCHCSLFTTSTLAVGANLPAFLVIIKGTFQYQSGAGTNGKGWKEVCTAPHQQRLAHHLLKLEAYI